MAKEHDYKSVIILKVSDLQTIRKKSVVEIALDSNSHEL